MTAFSMRAASSNMPIQVSVKNEDETIKQKRYSGASYFYRCQVDRVRQALLLLTLWNGLVFPFIQRVLA